MANEMPDAQQFQGLSRKVLQYCNGFKQIADKIRGKTITDADWDAMESLVDVAKFQRVGVFLRDHVETTNWPDYKKVIAQYGGSSYWEGTLRRITELPNLVFLELDERSTRNGMTDFARTLTIYEFDAAQKLRKLDVYVAHVAKRPAGG